MKYIITGTLSVDRKTIIEFLTSKGWEETTKTNADYLIVGDKPGSKLEWAINNRLKILKEKHIVEMLGEIKIEKKETEEELTKRIKEWMIKTVKEFYLEDEELGEGPYFYDWIRNEFDLKYDDVPSAVWDYDEELIDLMKSIKKDFRKFALERVNDFTGSKEKVEVTVQNNDYRNIMKNFDDLDDFGHLYGLYDEDHEDIKELFKDVLEGKERAYYSVENDFTSKFMGKKIIVTNVICGDNFSEITFYKELD